MCLLREKSSPHSYFRKSLLAFFSLLLTVLVFSCAYRDTPGEPSEPEGKTDTGITAKWWFFDRKGRLVSSESAEAIPPAPPLPWTGQIRITGFCQTGEYVTAVINTQGWYTISVPPTEDDSKFPMWCLFREPDLFQGRSAGQPFVHNGRVILNLFTDTILTPIYPDNGENALIFKPSVLALTPEKGTAEPLFRNNPLKESEGFCTSLYPYDTGSDNSANPDGMWISSWRIHRKGELSTVFGTLDPVGGYFHPVSAEEFRKKVEPQAIEKIDPSIPLSELLREWKKENGDIPANSVLDFELHKPGNGFPRIYRQGDETGLLKGNAGINTIPLLLRVNQRGEEELLGLFPDQTVRIASPEGVETIVLPNPGKKRTYTALWALDNSLLIAWEYMDFTLTGEAGVLELERK